MTDYKVHTLETAPEGSRERLSATEQKVGFIPNMLAVMSESPVALEAYQGIQGTFAKSTLSNAEQQFTALSISISNGCDYCVPVYSMFSAKAGVPQDIIDAVRDGNPIEDDRYSALRTFSAAIVEKRGQVSEAEIEAFLGTGFTKAQVLEVIVGAAFKLISNYTNHIANIPLDEAFQ
jgi:uncharacterized peroxidase-related enzyme